MKQKIFTKSLLNLVLAVSMTSFGMSAMAQEDGRKGHAIGANVSFYGLGAFHTYRFNENWHLRSTINGGSIDDLELEISKTDYEGDADSAAAGIMLDWYPADKGWQRKIFISSGIFYADTEYDACAERKPGKVINIGDARINSMDIESLNLKVENQQVVPYIGVGWGDKPRGDEGFAFVGELGLRYLSDPDVKLIANDPGNLLSAENLRKERKDIADDLGGFNAFASVGVSYHF